MQVKAGAPTLRRRTLVSWTFNRASPSHSDALIGPLDYSPLHLDDGWMARSRAERSAASSLPGMLSPSSSAGLGNGVRTWRRGFRDKLIRQDGINYSTMTLGKLDPVSHHLTLAAWRPASSAPDLPQRCRPLSMPPPRRICAARNSSMELLAVIDWRLTLLRAN